MSGSLLFSVSLLLGALSTRSHALMVWGALAAMTVAMLLVMRTRWAREQPLSKCIALSVFAHIALAGFAYGTRIFVHAPRYPEETIVHLAFVGRDSDEQFHPVPSSDEQFGTPLTEPGLLADVPQDAAAEELPPPAVQPSEDEPELLAADDDAPAIDDLVPDEREPADAADDPPASAEAVAEQPAPTEEHTLAAALPPPDAEADEDDATLAQEPTDPLAEAVADVAAAEQPMASDSLPAGPVEMPVEDGPPADPLGQATADSIAVEMVEQASDPAEQPVVTTDEGDDDTSAARLVATVVPPTPRRPGDGQVVPRNYQARMAPERQLVLQQHGGSAQTEAAVAAALAWLAENQSSDGHWRAREFGAGREQMVHGHNRYGAGGQGDTGMSALAVLCFLGAGHTHYEGQYRENVQHGLEFLLRSQAADGSLAGNAELFAAMYCHGMAFLAISEAYAMTGDERLLRYVDRAQQFTLRSQIAGDGGWRYQSGDQQGDTSQLGWQLMALTSAQQAGLPLPAAARSGVEKFLSSVASGRHGGLASYRAGGKTSRTMTAEALLCRLLLEAPPSPEAVREATSYLREQLPGANELNFYYWYYGTLALFHLQDDTWRDWNDALQHQLLELQRREGPAAGSWDPDTVWGGYGGRVYTTAMATLCLEVYYRYLPLYARNNVARKQ